MVKNLAGVEEEIVQKEQAESRLIDIYETSIEDIWAENNFKQLVDKLEIASLRFFELWEPFPKKLAAYNKAIKEKRFDVARKVINEIDYTHLDSLPYYYKEAIIIFKTILARFNNNALYSSFNFIKKELELIKEEMSARDFERMMLESKVGYVDYNLRSWRKNVLPELKKNYGIDRTENDVLIGMEDFIEKREWPLEDLRRKLEESIGSFRILAQKIEDARHSTNTKGEIRWDDVNYSLSLLSSLSEGFIKKEFTGVLTVMRTRFIVPFRKMQKMKVEYEERVKNKLLRYGSFS